SAVTQARKPARVKTVGGMCRQESLTTRSEADTGDLVARAAEPVAINVILAGSGKTQKHCNSSRNRGFPVPVNSRERGRGPRPTKSVPVEPSSQATALAQWL